MVPTDWGKISVEGTVQVVVFVVCRGNTPEGPHLCQSANQRGVKIWIWGVIPDGSLIGAVDSQLTSTHPIHLCVISSSFLYAIPPCVRANLHEVVDLCCGIGAFTHLLKRVGMTVACGVDQNDRWESLFLGLHEGAKFLKGDINEQEVT